MTPIKRIKLERKCAMFNFKQQSPLKSGNPVPKVRYSQRKIQAPAIKPQSEAISSVYNNHPVPGEYECAAMKLNKLQRIYTYSDFDSDSSDDHFGMEESDEYTSTQGQEPGDILQTKLEQNGNLYCLRRATSLAEYCKKCGFKRAEARKMICFSAEKALHKIKQGKIERRRSHCKNHGAGFAGKLKMGG